MKRVHLIKRYIKLLILTSVVFNFSSSFADPMVIFTASNDFSPLSSGKAKMLFKGKLKRLNNKKYSLIDWPAGSTTKKLFYQELIGQTEAKVNATRAKLIFSGKGFPPKVMDNGEMATLKTLLKTNNNSIGYALKADVSDEFTILYILETESSDEK